MGINALLGSCCCGLVTRCWGCVERSVSMMASLITLGTIACHMCAVAPNNTGAVLGLGGWGCLATLDMKFRGPCGKAWEAARP